MKVALKKAGEQLALQEVALLYRTDAVAAILGRSIEQRAVWLDSNRTLAFICDDLAAMIHKPINFYIEVPNPFSPVQIITGDVVFIRSKPCDPSTEEIWDYEVVDLLDSDIQLLNNLLDDGTQVSLAMEYFARGGC